MMKLIVRRDMLFYYVTLFLMLAGSLLPDWRLWGVNLWAFFPTATIAIAFSAAAVLPLALSRVIRPLEIDREQGADSHYLIAGALTLVFFAIALVVGRVGTHFTGDGYQLLSMLQETGYPFKSWDKGTGVVIESVHALTDSALTTYRSVSIGAGLVTLAALLVSSRYLFQTTLARLLFVFGVMTSGGAMLFFGYVENYALLAAMVVLFTLLGILHTARGLSRWWLLLPSGLAMLSHVFGVVVLPALIYLLVRETGPAQKLAALPRRMRGLILLGTVIVLGIAAVLVYSNSLFLQTALVPPLSLRFTPDNYSLLSLAHLVDFANLLILLLPGVVILAALLFRGKLPTEQPAGEKVFLWLLALSALVIAFVIDPNLGMPRDWDLFAFAGLILAAALFRPLCAALDHNRQLMRPVLLAVLLAILLGVFALTGRLVATQVEQAAIARIESFIKLDPMRHRATYRLLWDYYRSTDQPVKAAKADKVMEKAYPERDLVRQAGRLGALGRTDDAFILLRKALRIAPNWADVYFNMGYTFLMVDQVDSAIVYLRLSDALNPNNADTENAFGIAWLKEGDFEQAREHLERAVALDPANASALVSIVDIGIRTGDMELTRSTLERLARLEAGGIDGALALSRKLARLNELPLAAQALTVARQHGADSTALNAVLDMYPAMREIVNWE